MCGRFYDYVQKKAPDNFYILATVIGQYWTSRTHVEWPDSGYYFKLQPFVASKT